MCVFLSLWFTFGSLCEVRREVFVQILFTFLVGYFGFIGVGKAGMEMACWIELVANFAVVDIVSLFEGFFVAIFLCFFVHFFRRSRNRHNI